ncbi:CTP synthase [Hondaea fermentalgiana]|uniref:CTP synthase n=1 Tax=Hondaea fermentalgiana TaxID=2315210 RepID=A0A2R5GY43_9STRA|nr:CTP synthase [Hondaea fermentalgiana]|eukprot:GBG32894.1 CTP synthase [Hondaea fermentalgiana]
MSQRKDAHLRANSPINLRAETRFIFVTGGVVSGLGKGITISSIGRLLKASGVSVTSIKVDPYLNVDAGTMAPQEHGETFVLDDGGETDLDLGNYERFLDVMLTRDHNITTGKVYQSVIERERKGDFLGKTVQVVPHITNEIQDWIARVAQIPVDGTTNPPDVCLVEVGGTVGDIESMVFLEAIRQFQFRVGRERCCLVHVSLIPVLGSVGEQKTKPTQHGIKELMSLGLSPDLIVCRSSEVVEESTRKKISQFCHVAPSCVISVHDVSNIYHVPLILEQQGLHTIIRESLGLEKMSEKLDLDTWRKLAQTVDEAKDEVVIAVCGKYTSLHDSYLSVLKALKHSAIAENKVLITSWIESSDLEEETKAADPSTYATAWEKLRQADGILIPGGFGSRGVEGKVAAAKYAREGCVPLLGVCLGMQVMVIEYARNVLGWTDAASAEGDENTSHKVIIKMLEHHQGQMGGTMRLGSRRTNLHPLPDSCEQAKSVASAIYEGASHVLERHRHRYEVNPSYIADLEKGGLYFTGKDEANERMEMTELPRKVHPFYFGVQFHPELKSRPLRPSPPFHGFLLAACKSFTSHYGVPESTATPIVAPLPTPRSVKRKDSVSEFRDTSGAPGVAKMKRPRVISDSN